MRTNLLLIILLIISAFGISVQNGSGNKGKLCRKWKVDQFYADSMRIYNSTIDSLRYDFKHNGDVDFGLLGSTATIQWRFENNDQFLVLYNDSIIGERYKIEYLSSQSLIFTSSATDTLSNRNFILEYRLIPITNN